MKNSILIIFCFIIIVSCNSNKQKDTSLTEFFLGIPANCSFDEAEQYMQKLYSDTLIKEYTSYGILDDSVPMSEMMEKGYIRKSDFMDLKMVGIDTVTKCISSRSEFSLSVYGKVQTMDLPFKLYFYNDKLLALQINTYTIFTSDNIFNHFVDLYKDKYGNPDIASDGHYLGLEKRNISGICNSYIDNDSYVSWEEEFRTEETSWYFSNAAIKLVDLQYKEIKVSVSEYSFKKAEDFYGKKYGFWDESYLHKFLSGCPILNKETGDRSQIFIFYINKKVQDIANKDVKLHKDKIDEHKKKENRRRELKDSALNEEKLKKLKQQII